MKTHDWFGDHSVIFRAFEPQEFALYSSGGLQKVICTRDSDYGGLPGGGEESLQQFCRVPLAEGTWPEKPQGQHPGHGFRLWAWITFG
jgi:hypothetical protein